MYQPLLSDLQLVFVNVLGFIWSISAGIFFYQLLRTGYEYIIANGDTKKYETLKGRTPKLIQGLVLTLSAYIIALSIIAIIGIKSPDGEDCFSTPLATDKIKFQFVFPVACNSKVTEGTNYEAKPNINQQTGYTNTPG